MNSSFQLLALPWWATKWTAARIPWPRWGFDPENTRPCLVCCSRTPSAPQTPSRHCDVGNEWRNDRLSGKKKKTVGFSSFSVGSSHTSFFLSSVFSPVDMRYLRAFRTTENQPSWKSWYRIGDVSSVSVCTTHEGETNFDDLEQSNVGRTKNVDSEELKLHSPCLGWELHPQPLFTGLPATRANHRATSPFMHH